MRSPSTVTPFSWFGRVRSLLFELKFQMIPLSSQEPDNSWKVFVQFKDITPPSWPSKAATSSPYHKTKTIYQENSGKLNKFENRIRKKILTWSLKARILLSKHPVTTPPINIIMSTYIFLSWDHKTIREIIKDWWGDRKKRGHPMI